MPKKREEELFKLADELKMLAETAKEEVQDLHAAMLRGDSHEWHLSAQRLKAIAAQMSSRMEAVKMLPPSPLRPKEAELVSWLNGVPRMIREYFREAEGPPHSSFSSIDAIEPGLLA